MIPEPLLRWRRKLIAKDYYGSKRRRPGRPKTTVETRNLVLRMAREYPRGLTIESGVYSTMMGTTSAELRHTTGYMMTFTTPRTTPFCSAN